MNDFGYIWNCHWMTSEVVLIACLFLNYWHINLLGLFNAKSNHLEEQQWYYLIHSWEDRWRLARLMIFTGDR